MNQTLTLLGTLGQTLELRDTTPFFVEVDERNSTPMLEILPHATGGFPFGIFVIAPHGPLGSHPATRTIRCIAFDVESPHHRRLREARPGELVAVTGRWESYTVYLEETDDRFTFPQFVVEDLRVLDPGLAAKAPCGGRVVLDRRERSAA